MKPERIALTAFIAVLMICGVRLCGAQNYSGIDLYALESLPNFPQGSGGGTYSYLTGSARAGQVAGSISFSINFVSGDVLLWNAPHGAVTDLTPASPSEFVATGASATNGLNQVGFGNLDNLGLNGHALLWTGADASFVDLHPTNLAGYTSSFAYGISPSGSQQVGEAKNSAFYLRHALELRGELRDRSQSDVAEWNCSVPS